MGDPHREQNARSFPGDDSYSRRVSMPETSRKLMRSTGAFAACAEPLAFRQLVQWQ